MEKPKKQFNEKISYVLSGLSAAAIAAYMAIGPSERDQGPERVQEDNSPIERPCLHDPNKPAEVVDIGTTDGTTRMIISQSQKFGVRIQEKLIFGSPIPSAVYDKGDSIVVANEIPKPDCKHILPNASQ